MGVHGTLGNILVVGCVVITIINQWALVERASSHSTHTIGTSADWTYQRTRIRLGSKEFGGYLGAGTLYIRPKSGIQR